MNEQRFDSLAKTLTSSPTRRKTLGWLTGATGLGLLLAAAGLGGLANHLGLAETAAVKRKGKGKGKGKGKKKRSRGRQNGGSPLYPDLVTLAPRDLHFAWVDTGGVPLHVLRFTNTIWNQGQGRLELESNFDPLKPGGKGKKGKNKKKKVFQNLYDAPVGGHRVGRKLVNGRIIYHEAHGHYHFADFASYTLVRCLAGDEQCHPITPGTKTSFCVTDVHPMPQQTLPRTYPTCQRRQQGLTPGWGDTYASDLPEQWVVIPLDGLEDGNYGLQSTVDPRGLLDEGGGAADSNNTAVTFFTANNGDIENVHS